MSTILNPTDLDDLARVSPFQGGPGLRLVGANGEDNRINGTDSNDRIVGGRNGDDVIDAGEGNDIVRGKTGNDLIFGGPGDDNIRGGAGRDTLDGGVGDDTLNGGRGADVINGGRGANVLKGGGGRDTFVFEFFDGEADTIRDFRTGRDTIDLSALGATSANTTYDRSSGELFVNGELIADLGNNTRLDLTDDIEFA